MFRHIYLAISNYKCVLLIVCPLPRNIVIILSHGDETFGKKHLNCIALRQKQRHRSKCPRKSLDNDAVPLWVRLVVFVSLVFNHSVAADADVWPGHLHPIQSDPATHTDTTSVKGNREMNPIKETTREMINRVRIKATGRGEGYHFYVS